LSRGQLGIPLEVLVQAGLTEVVDILDKRQRCSQSVFGRQKRAVVSYWKTLDW